MYSCGASGENTVIRPKCLDAAEIITVSSLLPALLSTGCTFAYFYSCKVLNADSLSPPTTNIFFPLCPPSQDCTSLLYLYTFFRRNCSFWSQLAVHCHSQTAKECMFFFFSRSLLHALIMSSMQNRLALRLHWVAEADRGFVAHVTFVWRETN